MFNDGSSFFRRAVLFKEQLESEAYPSAGTLAKLVGCHRNTAQRTIDRLREEFGLPIEYDPSKKGYYLTDASYIFPTLCAGKDELISVLLMRDFAESIDAIDLQKSVDTLWLQFVAVRNPLVSGLEKISRFFSSDLTATGTIAEAGLLEYLDLAAAREVIRIRYKSPWRHKEERQYSGTILRVHLSDGTLYLLFDDELSNRRLVLNASFIRSIEKCSEIREDDAAPVSGPWSDSFGVWIGSPVENVVIRIAPPAAEYYASKVWHGEQQDSWEGEVLVRSMPSPISPELVTRIAGIGEFIVSVEPKELKAKLLGHLEKMIERLS